MAMAPLLFVAGITFGYFVVLPGAVGFLQNFNASSFDALVQASSYYRFILADAARNRGVLPDPDRRHRTDPRRDRHHTPAAQAPPLRDRRPRRAGAVAPGTDPVTTLLELIPMLVLYELSIFVARLLERRRKRASDPRPGRSPRHSAPRRGPARLAPSRACHIASRSGAPPSQPPTRSLALRQRRARRYAERTPRSGARGSQGRDRASRRQRHLRAWRPTRSWRVGGLSSPPLIRPAFVSARVFVRLLPNCAADAAASRAGRRRCC